MKLPLFLAVFATFLVPALAETASTVTAAITVDTRGGTKVRGQVVDGTPEVGPYLPLAGVAVSIGGANGVTGANGSFELAAPLTTPTAFNATKTDFMPYTVSVSAPATGDTVDLGLITMEPTTDGPYIESLTQDNEGLFLQGWGLTLKTKAKVNWNGYTPESVKFLLNGKPFKTLSGTGPEYTCDFAVDKDFTPSLQAKGNEISVIATGKPSDVALPNKDSKPELARCLVISPPAALATFLANPANRSSVGPNLKLSLDFPRTKPFRSLGIPVIGAVGGEVSVLGELRYNITSGEWSIEAGERFKGVSSQYSRFKLGIGTFKDITAEIKGKGTGTATISGGMDLSQFQVIASLGMGGNYAIAVLSPYGIVGPGLAGEILDTPVLNEVVKATSVVLWARPSLTGQATLQAFPTFDFKSLDLTGKAAIEATYEPDLGRVGKFKLYVGGEPSLKFGLPGEFFRELKFKAYAGIEAKVWVFKSKSEYVFVDYAYPSRLRRAAPGDALGMSNGSFLPAQGNALSQWQVIDRPWREDGPETFLPGAKKVKVTDNAPSAGEQFSQMGTTSTRGAVYTPSAKQTRKIISDAGVPAQVALPLLGNVYPDSEPSLTARGNTLMLAYVRDNGAANPLQFTEVAWTFYDGSTWTTPAPIAANVRGQFEPTVRFDGAGNAVAVWTQVKNASFAGTNVEQMSAEMEIVTAKWDAASRTWGAATALTDNAFLDHKPRLAGPMTNGDLILTWRENQANHLIGEGASGTPGKTRILSRRWISATSTWSAVEVLMSDLANEMSDSLAAKGDKAVLTITRDLDGNLTDFNDSELFYRVRNDTTGTWGPLTRHTTDALYDREAKVTISDTGAIYCLWQRGNDLVMDVNFSGAPTVVRADSGGMGFADFSLTVGPSGNVVALWQEMDEYGSDAHYRVYDPASSSWGLDTLLSQDADLERSFSPAWDAMGNLVLAYNNVTITKQNKTVTLDGGNTVEVTGVPQPSSVDLLLAKRALVKDLSISANGLTAEGTTYLPGGAITLKAKVKNSGNVAVLDVPVSFYDGDPAAGGTLIQSVTLSGWLKASDEAEATVNWTIPQPAIARTVYVRVDPAGIVTESNETNNTLSLPLNGVDLQAQYISGTVLRDGSARVVVRVTSLSAPESPVTTLKLKTETGTTALAQVNVSQLSPGTSIDIPLSLPAGSQPEGERAYRVTLDEEALTGDVDATNNEILFRLNLWIDGDNDGLPNEWEVANGFSDANAADALLDSDGDGFSNRMEYLAGTNPRNGASVLKIGQVAQRSIADGGGVAISWLSTAGRLYNLERSYDLTNWVVLSRNTAATPPMNTVVDPVPAPFGKAFYRLVLLESADAYNYAPLTRSIAFQAKKQEKQGAIDAQLSWDSLAGKTYAVERSTDLVNWRVIAEKIPANLPRNTYTDHAPLSQTKAFYRVLEK